MYAVMKAAYSIKTFAFANASDDLRVFWSQLPLHGHVS